jgi:Undecaprenyl-phosphate glucose phosphotransferase
LLPLVAFTIAAYLRFFSQWLVISDTNFEPKLYFELLLSATIIWAAAAEHFGLYRLDHIFAATGKTRRLLAACACAYAGVAALLFFYRGPDFSRFFVTLSAIALFFLAGFTRIAFRVLIEHARRNGRHSIRVLIVGADENARKVACQLTEGQAMPCTVVGFVRLPGQETRIQDRPVIEWDAVSDLTFGRGIDDVVIALPANRFGELREVLAKFQPLCAPMRVVLDFAEGISLQDQLFEFGGIPMLDLRVTPAESLSYLVVKRGFDFSFSLLVILLTAPLMALIALAIKLTSRGPVIFSQDRVGLNGQIFRMYKFRTMRVGTAQESNTRWTTANDDRRTMIGTFLRKSNLDELPQFFNVLKGDMSVVGPRPERPFFVTKFLKEVAAYSTRHYLKAGITGWAQVNGWRGDTCIQTRLEHDLYYLQHFSITFDLQIILMTLLRSPSNKNAY